MSEITLFGACEMTPARFAAMAPHLKTEALRLMSDCGCGVGAVEKLTGEHRASLLGIYNAQPQFKLRDEDRATPPKGPRVASVSATARLILLQMLHQAGALAASLNSIAYDLGKSTTSVRHALQQLVTREMIELTVPARGTGHPAQYRLTDAGEALAAQLEQGALQERADA